MDPASPSPRAGRQKSLEDFRTPPKHLQLHPAERTLLWLVAAQLVALPWALGTMRLAGQILSLTLAVVAFTAALSPRDYTEEHSSAGRFRLLTWPKLLRFPVFWLGLALLTLVIVQALNPAWVFERSGTTGWTRAIPHKTWLPSGVAAPFERWGPWRMLMIYASAWLTICATWIGFTRRRSVQLLLIVLAANGALLAAFGLLQRMLTNGKLFWFLPSPNPLFFASFIYKNHAGAYLNLMLAVAAGLAAWYHLRGLRRLEKSNPAGVFVFAAALIAVSVVLSLARGATILTVVFIVLGLAGFVVHRLRGAHKVRNAVIALTLLAVVGFSFNRALPLLLPPTAIHGIEAVFSGGDPSVRRRQQANVASLDMLRDHWRLGVGSGGFQFLFPDYQHRYPEITIYDHRPMFWEHAHNDILEIPIELGVPGVALLLGGFGYGLFVLVRHRFWRNPLSGALMLGCALLVVHAWGEFVFQCPAILVTWCVLWTAAGLWARLDDAGGRA